MAYLSTPIGDLRPEYDVVVVGSGYGGAIAALRTLERSPSSSVCVLERGPERQAGDFPSTIPSALGQFQVDTRMGRVGRRTALFDMRINKDVSVLVGCGLGGTSLINAGVMIEPLPEVLSAKDWPLALRQPGALRSEFNRVRATLGVHAVPPDVALPKVTQLFEAGSLSDPPSVGRRPAVAVSFVSSVDRKARVQYRRCTLCGDCFTGCNHAAKNTVDRNYLARARNLEAAIFCAIDVRTIEPLGNHWLLHVRLLDRAWQRFGAPELTIRAGAIFLAAGTLGSTEILLRSRDGLSMSRRLGERFSGNGDAIAFGYNSIERVDGIGYGRVVPDDAAVGPTIAGMLDERRQASGAMIQEGAVPGLLGPLLRVAAPIIARVTRVPGDRTFDLSLRHLGRELHSLVRGVHHGALARTQTFLCMSREDGSGTMGLVRNRLRVAWDNAGEQAPFHRMSARLAAITRARGGRYVINPFWSRMFGRRLVTVHPLGGCAMANDASKGVVNSFGRVFKGEVGATLHPHLYVCDGSIVPTSLGANPALTISALAERIAGAAKALPAKVKVPKPRRIDPALPGIRYAERLRGWLELNGRATRIELVLHISAENVEALLTTPAHEAKVVGVARTPQLETTRWTVTRGTLSVMIDDPRQVDTTLLVYQLRLTARDGRAFWLVGHKTLNLATTRRGTWRAITQLPFAASGHRRLEPIRPDGWRLKRLCNGIESRAGSGIDGERARRRVVRGRGEVRSSVLDAMRLGASLEIVYERSLIRRLKYRLRYLYFFADGVFQARAWLFRRAVRAQPFNRPKLTPPEDITAMPVIDKHVEGPRFLLTRYRKGNKTLKPVIVAPGFGMSADCFLAGTPSLVQFLCDRTSRTHHTEDDDEYEVWLLDYRGSDHLPVSLTQFTLDDLVEDFGRAVAVVRDRADGQKVRIIGHCVASLVTTLMLLKDRAAGEHVQSAILSQTHVFQDHPLINRIKAWTRLSKLLRIAGFRPVLTSDHDVRSGRGSRLLDLLLRLYPTVEHCSSPVCRRTLLMYGEVIRHRQIDRHTHDLLYDLFDRSNLTMLEHMSLLVRRGHAVDRHGREVYLTKANGRNLRMPLTIIQGRLNRLFRPIAADRTHRWMLEYGHQRNRTDNDRLFQIQYFEHYAHLDHFLGARASDEVYPELVKALKRMDDSATTVAPHAAAS